MSASDTFQRIKDTITAIVEEYGITNRLRYALIVFGRDATQKLSFSEEITDIDSLKAKIQSSQRPVGDPNLQKALEEAKRLFDSDPSRPDVKKVIVVITDKKSSNRPEDLKKAVMPLEEEGVIIVPVAVGSSADPTELEGITSNRGYLIVIPQRELDPDVTAETIMEKVLKGIVSHVLFCFQSFPLLTLFCLGFFGVRGPGGGVGGGEGDRRCPHPHVSPKVFTL